MVISKWIEKELNKKKENRRKRKEKLNRETVHNNRKNFSIANH